jgi:hypothetical protein
MKPYRHDLAYGLYRDTLNRCYSQPGELSPELKGAAARRAIEDAQLFEEVHDQIRAEQHISKPIVGTDALPYRGDR